MKRFALIIAVLLGMVSCSKEAMIAGTWELKELTVNDITLSLHDMGLDMKLTFDENGKLISSYSIYGISANDEYTYSIDKESLIIDETVLDYDLTGKILTIYGGGDLLKMDGEIEVVFHKI